MPQQPTPTFRSPHDSSPRTVPAVAVSIAGVVVAVAVAILLALSNRHHAANPNQPQPLDPYAGSLAFSKLAMSESTSLSGGKSTFLDGEVTNKGSRTVSGITVQALFRNDEGMPPHLETLPVSLIRTREPYVDTQPVSVSPLKPGDVREFRLIFESIPNNWNTQLPELHVTGVKTR